MKDIKGFLKVKRKKSEYRPVCERINDFCEVLLLPKDSHTQEQASRCMDCGTAFCNWGCPVGNHIPEWNDLAFRGNWQKAFQLLDATNNFPEITGRICPATCEYACVLGINDDPVTIRENELAIIEHSFKAGLVKPKPPKKRTGKRIAVVGSGPAGLSCATQLNKAGHNVVVFERDALIGGILRFGIPDFKLEKWILDRRLKILEKEGIEFVTSVNVGIDYSLSKLKKEFDAICLAIGCRVPRDFPPKADQPTAEKIEGRSLTGIYFAMDYLIQSNKRIADRKSHFDKLMDARDKNVVVIGGGDTGADCVGVAHRQLARCVVQIELLPKPAECRTPEYLWPKYPMILKTSTSHEEGGMRLWSVLTKKFIGENGQVRSILCSKVEFQKDASGCPVMKEVGASEFQIEADLVILALGFLHPEKPGLIEQLHLELDSRGCVKTDENFMTKSPVVFACGDMHRGQSLIVWAISEGRRCAHFMNKLLIGETALP